MDFHSPYLILAIVFGFLMAWGIGANDVANAMGTSVGSKAITIRQAILIAAVFEFLGAFLAGGEVTETIKQDIIDVHLFLDHPTLFALGMLSALLSSALWLFIASWSGWPVSTTHTIVGAVVGVGLMQGGLQAIQWKEVFSIMGSWILSPLLGGSIAFLIFTTLQKFIFNTAHPIQNAKKVVPIYISFTMGLISFLIISQGLQNFNIHFTFTQSLSLAALIAIAILLIGLYLTKKLPIDPKVDEKFRFANVERIFKILMLFTGCTIAFAHGSNDVANAIGPVSAIVSISQSPQHFLHDSVIPTWLLLLGASGIVTGLAMYGHKVMATIGTGITQLTPSRGFSAELATAATVVLASVTGLPISTTHTLVGAILGVGLARGIGALNISVIRNIFMSWLITLPAGALFAVMFLYLLKALFPNP